MTTIKTVLIALLACGVMVFSACGNNKQSNHPEEITDTLMVDNELPSNEEATNTENPPPVDEVAEEITPEVAKEVAVKCDISAKGTIVDKGDIWVIRTTGPDGTDYLPSNLAAAFKVDGKLVTFEANFDEIPSGVRMAGKPITLISIK